MIVMTVLFGHLPAHAEGGQSRFHLLNMKCEAEAHDQMETSPQSPPLNVDDPATPGCNQWEINILASADLSLDANRYELPLLDINYGVGDNLQLKYEVPNVSSRSDGTTVSSVGNSKAGIKYMFYENEEAKLHMAFYPQIEFITPQSGAEEKGLETAGAIVSLPFLLSTKLGQTVLGDVMMTTNLCYNISSKSDTSNSVSLLAGLGMPLSSKISMMAELSTDQAVTQNSEGVRDQLVKSDVGMMVKVFKQVLLFGSVGGSLYSSDQNHHTYFSTGIRI